MIKPAKYSKLSQSERKTLREAYIKEQGGYCFWCLRPLDKNPPDWITNMTINWKLFPQGFLNAPVHLQHDHETDMTEGAVHAYCNAVMWQYHGR